MTRSAHDDSMTAATSAAHPAPLQRRLRHAVPLVLACSLCILAALPTASWSQLVPLAAYPPSKLPHAAVEAVAQDGAGYLWIGTPGGAARYDGTSFAAVDMGGGLAEAGVAALAVSADGSIWIATRSAVSRHSETRRESWAAAQRLGGPPRWLSLSPDGKTVFLATSTPPAVGVLEVGAATATPDVVRVPLPSPDSVEAITALSLAGDGTLLVGTKGLGVLVSARGGEAVPLSDATARRRAAITAFEPLRSGAVAVASESGLALYASGTLRPINLPPEREWNLRSLESDASGSLYFGTASGEVFELLADQLATPLAHPRRLFTAMESPITRLLLDSRRLLWAGSEHSGLLRVDLDRNDGAFLDESTGLPDNSVRAIFEDREQTIWIGALAGLAKVRSTAFLNYRAPAGSAAETVWGAARLPHGGHRGELLVATSGGLAQLRGRFIEPLGTSAGMPLVGAALSLLVVPPATAFVGGADEETGGIARVDFSGSEPIVSERYGRESGLPSGRVPAVERDREGRLLAGTAAGLARLHDGAFRPVPLPGGRGPDSIRAIRRSRQSGRQVWIASNQGLILLSGEASTRYTAADGLLDDDVASVTEDDSGKVWISYRQAPGISSVDLRDPPAIAVRSFGPTDGLPRDAVSFVGTAAGSNAVWLGTTHGLFRFDPASGRVVDTFDEDVGLVWNLCSPNAFFADDDGTIWFGTGRGLSHFVPGLDRPAETVPPRVVIREATLGGGLAAPSGQEVGTDRADFRVAFSALSFVDEAATRFRYRLVGYDRDWSALAPERRASYTNLPAGSYRFEAQAETRFGAVGGAAASVAFRIVPPFLETGYFRTAVLAGGLGLLLGLLRIGIRRARRRQTALELLLADHSRELAREKKTGELEQKRAEDALKKLDAAHQRMVELDRAKAIFFENASHELRNPLTTVIGLTQAALSGRHGPITEELRRLLAVVHRSSHQLLDLVNKILDLQSLGRDRQPLKLARVDFNELMAPLIEAATMICNARDLTLRFSIADPPPTVPIDVDLFDKVPVNVLSNAIKYTPRGGSIDVTVLTSQETLRLAVRDTGLGIPESELPYVFDRFRKSRAESLEVPGSGLGLAVVKEIVELHGGSVSIASSEGEGTETRVHLPLMPRARPGDAAHGQSEPTAQLAPRHERVEQYRQILATSGCLAEPRRDDFGDGAQEGEETSSDSSGGDSGWRKTTGLVLRLRTELDGKQGPALRVKLRNGRMVPMDPVPPKIDAFWWGETRLAVSDLTLRLTMDQVDRMLLAIQTVDHADKRSALRVEGLQLPCELRCGESSIDTKIVDLSATGCGLYLSARSAFPIKGDRVTVLFRLHVEDEPLSLNGEVRWRGEQRAGVRFEYDEIAPSVIQSFVLERIHAILTGGRGMPGSALVVAVDAAQRAYLASLLERSGAHVVAVASATAALELMREHPVPDVVVADWSMPDLNGPMFIVRLRTEWGLANLPVLLMTARGESSAAQSLSFGADDYIAKPFAETELLARVRNLLVREQRRKEVGARVAELEAAVAALSRHTLERAEDIEGETAAAISAFLTHAIGPLLRFAGHAAPAPAPVSPLPGPQLDEALAAARAAFDSAERMFASPQASRPDSIDLASFVADVVSYLKAGHPHVTMDYSAPPVPCVVHATRRDVVLILSSIVRYATAGAGAARTVSVRLLATEDGVSLVVEDNGAPLDDRSAEAIFSPEGVAPNVETAGMPGLATVGRIAERWAAVPTYASGPPRAFGVHFPPAAYLEHYR
ncbi:MAG: response regulator [Candidatus Schekmanbacteria bacterium]|nr:response regulator [Candidatus Schekmanbacteria bacterium]